jgi:hypothetical protein
MSAPHKYDQVGPDGIDTANITDWKNKDVTLYAEETIAVGASVAIDVGSSTHGLGKSVINASNAAVERACVIGVALEAVTTAGFINVRVAGYYGSVACLTGVAAGDGLVASATAGSVVDPVTLIAAALEPDIEYASEARVMGIALTPVVSSACEALLFDPGCFG